MGSSYFKGMFYYSYYSELLYLIGKICLVQLSVPPFSYLKNIGILKKVSLIPG